MTNLVHLRGARPAAPEFEAEILIGRAVSLLRDAAAARGDILLGYRADLIEAAAAGHVPEAVSALSAWRGLR